MIKKIFNSIYKYRKIIFALYFIVLIAVLIFKFPTFMVVEQIKARLHGNQPLVLEPQFVPFRTIKLYYRSAASPTDWFVKNLSVNILMFIPFGFLVSLKYNHRNKHCFRIFMYTTITSLLLSVTVETLQYLTNIGRADVDDIILNVLGGVIGIILFFVIAIIGKVNKEEINEVKNEKK